MPKATGKKKRAVRRWTFRRCDCGMPFPHGYFHNPAGIEIGDPFGSISSALRALERAIKAGEVPARDKRSLIAQIHKSGLPKRERASRRRAESQSMYELSAVLSSLSPVGPVGILMNLIKDVSKPTFFLIWPLKKKIS